MRKRTNLCYLADLWRETWGGTFTFLRRHLVLELVFVVITFMAAAIYMYHSGDDAMNAVQDSVVIGTAAVLFVFVCILIVKYGNADFKLWRADGKALDIKDAEIESLNKRIHDLQKPTPDMSITDAFDYVMRNANLTEEYPQMDPDDLNLIAAKAIKDRLSPGTLYLWGRTAGEFSGLDADYSDNALDRIAVDDWNKFGFTFSWVGYDEEIALYGEIQAESLIQATYAEERYLDLKFCSAQIKSIWPERPLNT